MVVNCTGGEGIIVDCGYSQFPPDLGAARERLQLNKLKERVKEPLDAIGSAVSRSIVMIVSHPDKDHLNLLPQLYSSPSDGRYPTLLILGGPAGSYFKKSNAQMLVKHFLEKVPIVFLSHSLDEADIKYLVNLDGDELIDQYIANKSQTGHLMGKSLSEVLSAKEIVGFGGFCHKFEVNVLSANAGQTPPGITGRGGLPFIYTFNPDDNTNGIVLKLTSKNNGQSAILTGDATGDTTNQVVAYHKTRFKQTPELKTDIMMACHHGSHTEGSNNEEWINATSPQSTIFSCATMYNHPSCPIVNKYEGISTISVPSHKVRCGDPLSDDSTASPSADRTKAVYSTHDSGTITATFESDKIQVITTHSGSFLIPRRPTTTGSLSLSSTLPGSGAQFMTPSRFSSGRTVVTPGGVGDGPTILDRSLVLGSLSRRPDLVTSSSRISHGGLSTPLGDVRASTPGRAPSLGSPLKPYTPYPSPSNPPKLG